MEQIILHDITNERNLILLGIFLAFAVGVSMVFRYVTEERNDLWTLLEAIVLVIGFALIGVGWARIIMIIG